MQVNKGGMCLLNYKTSPYQPNNTALSTVKYRLRQHGWGHFSPLGVGWLFSEVIWSTPLPITFYSFLVHLDLLYSVPFKHWIPNFTSTLKKTFISFLPSSFANDILIFYIHVFKEMLQKIQGLNCREEKNKIAAATIPVQLTIPVLVINAKAQNVSTWFASPESSLPPTGWMATWERRQVGLSIPFWWWDIECFLGATVA